MTIDFSCQDKTQELCEAAREHLKNARITIIGMGALGTAAAAALVRSGCEHLILVDDDRVEESNLPRQTLYDEHDIGRKKVEAAKERLEAINSQARIDARDHRLDEHDEDLIKDAEVVLDCTDNLPSRRAIDELCHHHQKPWVHAAVIGSTGELMAITPTSTRYAELIKGKETSEDCASQGVLSTAAIITGTRQAVMALRMLTGQDKGIAGTLRRIDCWSGQETTYSLEKH